MYLAGLPVSQVVPSPVYTTAHCALERVALSTNVVSLSAFLKSAFRIPASLLPY